MDPTKKGDPSQIPSSQQLKISYIHMGSKKVMRSQLLFLFAFLAALLCFMVSFLAVTSTTWSRSILFCLPFTFGLLIVTSDLNSSVVWSFKMYPPRVPSKKVTSSQIQLTCFY